LLAAGVEAAEVSVVAVPVVAVLEGIELRLVSLFLLL